jgi:beta-lactamase regulating signal transducer with metallopeptidase domain
VAERLLHLLLAQTLALALAVGVVRVLQRLLGPRFGVGAAYLCWLLVPVSLAAAALPHPATDALALRVDVGALAPAWAVAPSAPTASGVPPAWHGLVLTSWAAGALPLLLVLWRRQRRFEALVAGADPRLPAGSGPAVLGVLRRRVVLPQDFEAAFDPEERRLMLLHEGVHLRRADNAWNLLAAALLVLHWFNPVAWWAWRRLRADQETSCDAAVLRQEPTRAQATYAAALLKVQGIRLGPPVATAWQSSHPLVERIRMLASHRIPATRRRAGARLAALSILVAGIAGYALRAGAVSPPTEVGVLTDIEIRVDAGAPVHARLLTHAGETATLREDPDATNALSAPVEVAYKVTRLDGGQLQLDTTLRRGAPLATVGTPRLRVRDGEAASVRIKSDDGAHEVAVSFVARVLPGPPPPAVPALPAHPAPPVPPVPAPSAQLAS